MQKIARMLILFFSLVMTLQLPTNQLSAEGNTIYVDDSGGKDYISIQEAINAANAGDTIYVYSGTYDSIIINGEDLSEITIIGENKDNTVIDGDSSGHVVRAYETQVTGNKVEIHISEFTIKNAGGSGFDCISLSYAENSSIIDNKIINGDVGEGIQLDHCNDITIRDNTISNCQGSGISLSISTNILIENNLIQDNQKGIHLSTSSNNNNINSNTIKSNSQYGIYILQSISNYIYNNDFTDNDQNAQDTLSNYWNYNSQGNYWDDYNGYDNNSDDIGDTPYDIPGGVNQDDFPLGYFKEAELPGGGNSQPTAYVPSITPNPANIGESILFTGSGTDSDGFIEGYNWRSSIDGQLSTQSSFSSGGLSTGTHTIYFKVQDNEGTWSVEKASTLTINYVEDQEPIATINSIVPNPAAFGEIIYFTGKGTDDGVITAWKWISSLDGVISSNSSFEINDLSIGTHTIFFQVMDDKSKWSKQDTETIVVYSGSTIPFSTRPVANAGGPYIDQVNNEVYFNGSGSYDDGSIVEYFWDFGDGGYGNGKIQYHSYQNSGNYSIILTVTDDDGNISTDRTYVSIRESTDQEGNNYGSPSLPISIPFPIILAIELLLIAVIIAKFFSWMKKK